jgi:hypothetical protein
MNTLTEEQRDAIEEQLPQRDIPASNEIVQYFHCAKCLKEKPSNISPRDYAQLEVGFSILGVQVWCKRHECNVMHMDFQGIRHTANTSTVPLDKEGEHLV